MKILKILGAVAVCAMLMQPLIARSTGKISGSVTDKITGKGIPGVSIQVVGTTIVTSATNDGSYEILNVPEGTYSLRAIAAGYDSVQVDKVEVKAGKTTNVNFELSAKAINRRSIAVEAEKLLIKKDGSGPVPGSMSNGNSMVAMSIPDADQFSIHYPPYPIVHNTEEYDRIYEIEFLEASSNPLSTFSIDVDRASYTNSRRYLNQGYLPPADAVRIEEFINYFRYNYPQPESDHPFSITTEVSECPWKDNHKLLHIGLQGKDVPMDDIPPGNLVFLLDVSGSMTPANKLPLLKSAFKLLVDKLREEDRVAIVVYAGASGLVLDSTPGNQRKTIVEAIDNLYPGGSTAGAAGIKLAYEIAKKNFIKEGNNRVILATDGDFNVGVSSTSELVRMIEEKREDGIFLTVLGFGQGNLKDSRMEQLADKGNGNYAYIDNIMEAKKVLVSELGGTLFTIAKDVKIQVEFNPAKISAYRLIGYENRMLKKEDFNDDKKDAGEIGSGHSVTAIYEIIPVGEKAELGDVDPLKYQTSQIVPGAYENAEMLTVKFRYKKPDGDKSRLIVHTLKDDQTEFASTSDNFRFSAAVAEFGMLLRDSKHKGDSSYDQVIKLASGARGEDSEGYRAEFISLVKIAKELSKTVAEK
jgi:Ca-activated chloride channel family protein